MSDEQPFYAPVHKPAPPRERQPGEHLWAIRKDGQQLDCELRDHGPWSIEVQVYREREFLYGSALGLPRAGARGSRHSESVSPQGGMLVA